MTQYFWHQGFFLRILHLRILQKMLFLSASGKREDVKRCEKKNLSFS